MICVVDTHVLIWTYAGNASLSPAAAGILANSRRSEVLASDMTLTETARLIVQRRIFVDGEPGAWLAGLGTHATIVPVDANTAWLAARLPWAHKDPSDRQIVATALWHGLPLVTADRVIARDAKMLGLTVIW
jgi:PIN domain nuclease of toxin-antitoxin system